MQRVPRHAQEHYDDRRQKQKIREVGDGRGKPGGPGCNRYRLPQRVKPILFTLPIFSVDRTHVAWLLGTTAANCGRGTDMTKRSVISVLLLTMVTFGIYGIYWMVKTKSEMVQLGAEIPTAWLMILPIVSIYWMWKFSCGVEHVTQGSMGRVGTFLLMILLGGIGMLIVQHELNQAADRTNQADFPFARVA